MAKHKFAPPANLLCPSNPCVMQNPASQTIAPASTVASSATAGTGSGKREYSLEHKRWIVRTRLEMQGLVCAFVEFICRNTHVVRGIAAACADRVLCWYPALVCTESVESVRRGERMLHALERASGTRDFLVLADLLMAFASVLTRDAIELVYLSYARRLALFEGMHLTWSA